MEKAIIITLPKKKEMLKRLCKVSDNKHLNERFYPSMLKYAGEERVACGVVHMLICAVYDYTKDMEKEHADAMVLMLCPMMPAFIDALIRNKKIAEKAKKFLHEGLDVCARRAHAQDEINKKAEKRR